MSLTIGTRFGPYDILSALGAGGMGEVYRARDSKLNRDVALKVLPDLFAADADRLARFKREAHVLSRARSPRRSKPRTSAASSIAISSPRTSSSGPMASLKCWTSVSRRRWLQAPGLKSKTRPTYCLSHRVLYEMVAGRPAFPGRDLSEVLAGVIKSDPAWNALPSTTPASLRKLLHRCLQKDPKLRLRDIGEARVEIDETLAGPASEPLTAKPLPAPAAWRRPVVLAPLSLLVGAPLWPASSRGLRCVRHRSLRPA